MGRPVGAYLAAADLIYNRLAWAFDGLVALLTAGRVPVWRLSVLDWVDGERVLEVGFGTGELLIALVRRGHRVTGLEPSLAMQRVAGQKLRERGLDVGRVQGWAECLPFAGGAFDAVVCTLPTAYARDPRALAELHRVLAPPLGAPHCHGRLVLGGVCLYSAHPVLARVLGWLWGESPAVRLASFVTAVESAGFRSHVVVHRDAVLDLATVIGDIP